MDIICICHNIPLKEAIKKASSLGELQLNKICATKCGLCIPYIEKLYANSLTNNIILPALNRE